MIRRAPIPFLNIIPNRHLCRQLEGCGVIANLQRTIVAVWIVGTVVWVAAMTSFHRPGWALVGLLVALCAHAVVLGTEFAVMAGVNRRDSSPPSTIGQVIRAWWAEACAAPRVFLWQQPFRSQTWPDQINGCTDRRAVLLVHGFLCNRGFWNVWMERFQHLGVRYVAVNLEPVCGPIDAYAGVIEEAMGKLERDGRGPPVVVAHSMGGLAVRQWMTEGANRQRVHRFITLGTPHHGTMLAHIGFTANARQMRMRSTWREGLERAERGVDRSNTTCYFSHCDNIVFPASNAMLAGADNRHLPGAAHIDMVECEEPFEEVLRFVGVPWGGGRPTAPRPCPTGQDG